MRKLMIATMALALMPAFAIAAPAVPAKAAPPIARPMKAEKISLVKHNKIAVRHKKALKAKTAVTKL